MYTMAGAAPDELHGTVQGSLYTATGWRMARLHPRCGVAKSPHVRGLHPWLALLASVVQVRKPLAPDCQSGP